MEKVFSDKTEEGIRLIWMQFDPEKTAEGVRLLREAADAGDPDALCFLARTYMGEQGNTRASGTFGNMPRWKSTAKRPCPS